jgi:hypothetical protein
MYPAVDNPDSCEINAIIRFLHVKDMSRAEMNRELFTVCGQNESVKEIQDSGVECSKMDGRTNVHDEERSCRPSVVSDGLVQSERRRFTNSEFSYEFPHISRTVPNEAITVRLG